MRVTLRALLFALPALVSAFPSQTYDARFAALQVRHARVAERMVNPLVEKRELDMRQTSCSTQCSSASDSSGIAAYNACRSTDAVCICSALQGLSNGCLTCTLPAIGLSTSQFNQLCGSGATTSQCDSQCSDTTDVNANQAAGRCTTSSIDDPCVCAALNEMTSTCRSCLLQISGISSTDYSTACGSSGNSTSGGSNTSSASGSSTTGLTGSCTSQCSSTSDQSALTAGQACAQTDTACQCNALAKLSSSCLACSLAGAGLTNQQYQAVCGGASGGASGYSFTGAGSATSTASGAQPTTSGTSGGGFTVASCNSSCQPAADQTAITQGNACGAADVQCACRAFNAMDTPCRACILSSNGLTQQDLNAQCSAASSQGSASSTAGSSATNLPNTGGGGSSSGTLSGFKLGAKEVMVVMAVALGAAIFV